jgi:hypothetical protein
MTDVIESEFDKDPDLIFQEVLQNLNRSVTKLYQLIQSGELIRTQLGKVPLGTQVCIQMDWYVLREFHTKNETDSAFEISVAIVTTLEGMELEYYSTQGCWVKKMGRENILELPTDG